MEFLNSILQYLILPATIVGIISYFGKEIFNNYLNKKLELYKTDLDKAYYEHQIKFSKLHEKRAEILHELYKKLTDAEISIKYLMSPIRFGKIDEEKLETETKEKLRSFINYFSYNEIFFSNDTCKKIESMIELIQTIWGNFELNKMNLENIKEFPDDSVSERLELRERRKEIRKILEKNVPDVVHSLKEEFREIIGVKT